MAEVADKATLNFNDKNYIIEDMSDQARYIVAQLQDLQTQEGQMKAKLDQITVAAEGFKTLLTKQIEEDENPTEPEEVEGEVVQ